MLLGRTPSDFLKEVAALLWRQPNMKLKLGKHSSASVSYCLTTNYSFEIWHLFTRSYKMVSRGGLEKAKRLFEYALNVFSIRLLPGVFLQLWWNPIRTRRKCSLHFYQTLFWCEKENPFDKCLDNCGVSACFIWLSCLKMSPVWENGTNTKLNVREGGTLWL